MTEIAPSFRLSPLPHHREMVSHLKSEQAELWKWISSNRGATEHSDAVRLALLKSAYRVEPDSAARLYGLAQDAARRLEIDAPIVLYHSQRAGDGLNAHLAFLPDEVHVVLHGPVAEVLNDGELKALLGHELAHHQMWTGFDGELFIADQVLEALAHEYASETSRSESFRRFRLYAEIFCDRGGHRACGDLLPAVAALVKTETGVRDVNAESYLRQAEEIAGRDASKTAGVTHPECYIRARALKLWSERSGDAEADIRRMIEGEPALNQLDLLGQASIHRLTRRLIDAYLSRRWLHTDAVLGHARLFFDDYKPPSKSPDIDELRADLKTGDAQLRDYHCYVLLDFVASERELDDAAMAAALQLAEGLQFIERFEEIVLKELKIQKKQLVKLRRDAAKIVDRAEVEFKSK